MTHQSHEAYWRDLEAHAHLPEVQDIIRQEILSGTIRVRPKPGGGICIVPIRIPEGEGITEMETPPAPLQDETSPAWRPVRRRRFARR